MALTATTLLLRTIGIWFQVYLSKKIGAAGIGLFQLIITVYFLAVTLAVSGIRLAAMRLVAEELGRGRSSGARRAILTCLAYSILFSLISAVLLFSSSEFIGLHWLSDARTILSLRILACSLPFLAMSSVFSGYFTAVRRAAKASAVQIFEQLVRILITVLLLTVYLPKGLESACAAVAIAAGVGELFSFLVLFGLYITDVRRYNSGSPSPNMVKRMFQISIPVALSAYVTSGIRTVQQLLIPHGLKKSGASNETALATYGIINGMVLPILMFPSALLNAVSELIVPELAECLVTGCKNRLSYIITRVLNLSILTSICIMSIFFRYSHSLAMAIYNNSDAGHYILILAPLIPIMYLDSIVDGMLKGINQQVSSMGYNIIESIVGAVMIYLLLPKYAIAGYIFTIFVTRLLNFSLSLNRIIRVIKIRINFPLTIKALFCMFNALILSNIFFYSLSKVLKLTISSLFPQIALVSVVYYLLLRLMNCITDEDLIWFKSIFR